MGRRKSRCLSETFALTETLQVEACQGSREQWVTVRQAAGMAGCCLATIRRLLTPKGEVIARRDPISGWWLVWLPSLKLYLARHGLRKPGQRGASKWSSRRIGDSPPRKRKRRCFRLLTPDDRRYVRALVLYPPWQYGYAEPIWRTGLIQRLVRNRLGVDMSDGSVRYMLKHAPFVGPFLCVWAGRQAQWQEEWLEKKSLS